MSGEDMLSFCTSGLVSMLCILDFLGLAVCRSRVRFPLFLPPVPDVTGGCIFPSIFSDSFSQMELSSIRYTFKSF